MKYVFNTISALSFLALVTLTSCPGDDSVAEPSAGEVQFGLMEGTWNIASVSYDGTSRIDTWGTDFTLTFSGASEGTDEIWGGNFSTSGHNTTDEPDALTVWPTSGTWDFTGVTAISSFTRTDPDREPTVSIVQVSASSLVVTFTISENGRSEAIFDATWRFEFTK